MKVNRIDIIVSPHANKHRTYLYNELFDLAHNNHAVGQFSNDYITLKSLPETALKVLNKLKITFEKLSK